MVKKQLSNIVFLSLIAIIGVSCSSAHRKDRSKLLSKFKDNDFEGSLKFLKESKFYKDQKSALLSLLEEGMIYHSAGKYLKSSELFLRAKTLSDKLYTQRISSLLKSAVANDNYDEFDGTVYEISMLYFYQSLNFYSIFSRGETKPYEVVSSDGKTKKIIPAKKLSDLERRKYLQMSLAEIRAWDSFWKTYRNDEVNKSIFKEDLLAKVYGAMIHEISGRRNDFQTALSLYQDAYKLIELNYKGYSAYNKKFTDFNKQSYQTLKNKKLREKFFEKTTHYKNLESFLKYKILSLTKNYRANQYRRTLKRLNPDKEVLSKLKKSKKLSNISILFEGETISSKVAKKVDISLKAVAENGKDSKTKRAMFSIGLDVLGYFAANQLGLMKKGYSYGGHAAGKATAAFAGIEFEIPKINEKPINYVYQYLIRNKENKAIKKGNLVLVSPLGNISKELIDVQSSYRYLKIGARVGLKHAVAILSAYATYKAMAQKQGKMLAKYAAVAQYLLLSKGIAASEHADVRYWSTLPNEISLTSFYLPKGEFDLEILALSDENNKVIKSWKMGKIKVTDPRKKQILSFRKNYL